MELKRFQLMTKLTKDPLILITNDDGIESLGLKEIIKIIKKITTNYIVVAPESNCSGYGHSITLSRPIRLNLVSKNFYSCDGTPTDCIMIAISKILRNRKPDLIISGINLGENIGADVTYSGTVGAAFEGALLNIKSIAISKIRTEGKEKDNWVVIRKFIPNIITNFLSSSKKDSCILNINVPNISEKLLKGIKFTTLARRKPKGTFIVRKDAKGVPYYWLTTERSKEKIRPNTDIWAINNNFISITPLNIDITDYNYINEVKGENDQ